MNPLHVVAEETLIVVRGYLNVTPKRSDDGKGIRHACWMLEGIASKYVQNDKAHRWLGYAQAIIILSGELPSIYLDTVEKINEETL
ncbi:MAG: hypothetical protein GXP16_01485 [Gammaproteobacteria bacterium]|nr:hypothetical protein [Gammaproteobacteria bacterium]